MGQRWSCGHRTLLEVLGAVVMKPDQAKDAEGFACHEKDESAGRSKRTQPNSIRKLAKMARMPEIAVQSYADCALRLAVSARPGTDAGAKRDEERRDGEKRAFQLS